MCLDNSPRCVWVTHEKECVYSHLFVCSFEDKNRCVAVTHFVLECRRWWFTKGSNCRAFTGKVLVFWLDGRLITKGSHSCT